MLHPLQPTSKIYLQQSLDNKDSLPYEQRVRQIVEKTKSHILLLNPEKKHTDVQCIIAMNRSIRKINGLDH